MDKVQLRRLPVTTPPIPPGGGRVQSPAGELAQLVNGDSYQFLAYLEFRPDATKPRGNHYHAHKTETLYLISGRVRAVYHDLDSGERARMTLEPGDLVTVQPRCAHVYYALEHSQAVELANRPYDPADTHPYEVTETV
ncbi:cupin domain-containing protein [Micromonospora coriariae]|uniref:cupin domain-containing protein n=1 Tax=Micromonospora coriariae TaxID=285665 RepID=UPI000B5B0C50|nr:cupin domain-containing protein [Micromonospora coriariae]